MEARARTEQLRELMASHRLKPKDVGEILGRSAQTVRVWRCRWDDRGIPAHLLRLLELELAARTVAE